jgi:hypothetical protein
VKSFEPFIFERNLAQSLSFDAFRHARIGIDVSHYASRLLNFKREALLDGVGGFPWTLLHYIEGDCAVFKEYDITPVFVLSGNDTVDTHRAKAYARYTTADRQRNRAWNSYAAAENLNQTTLPLNCAENFKDFNTPFLIEAIVSDLISFFIKNDYEYIRAPYLSWAQLGYLYEQNYIHAIYGPTETALLSQVDKFIIGMDFAYKELRFVDRQRLLNEVGLSQAQLIDIAISVGCDLQQQTLDVFSGYGPSEYFDIALSIMNANGTLYSSIVQLPAPQLEAFQKGVMALQFMPVLKNNGRVEIYSFDERKSDPPHQNLPPQDLYEMFAVRLPQEYYYYQSIGLIHNKILESIANQEYVEKAPLDGTSLKEYKDLVAAMLPIKAKEVNLLTKNMNRYFQFKTVKYSTFWGESLDIPHKPAENVFKSLQSITLRSDIEHFTLSEFYKTLSNEPLLGKPVSSKLPATPPLSRNFEILSTSLLRTLNIFDLYSTKSKPETFGVLQTLDPRFQEQYVLLLAFLKLSGKPLFEDLSQKLVGDSRTTDTGNKEVVLLISRLACLIQAVQKKKFSYSGPISRSLLVFRSSIDLIMRNFRELLESILVASLCGDEVEKLDLSNNDWRQLVYEIPFSHTLPSTVTGIITQAILDQFFILNNFTKAKTAVFNTFEYAGLEHAEEDVTYAFKFVREAFKLVKALEEDGRADKKLVEVFKKADELAKQFLESK